MKIVTGYTGEPHITSNDDQARNQGIFGTGNYVLGTGNKLNAVLTNATTVTLEDGDGMLQGVHFRIDPGTTEAVSISPGTTGYNRIDLICARYTKDAGTGVEDVSLVVIEGTPSSSTPSAPTYNTGDVLDGDTPVDFPLWKVTLTGLTPAISRMKQPVETEWKTLLWETGDPTTTPSPDMTQINIDLSGYSYVEITCEIAFQSTTARKTTRHKISSRDIISIPISKANSSSNWSFLTYFSGIEVGQSYITIEKGNLVTIAASSVTSAAGNYFTPVEVYGIL